MQYIIKRYIIALLLILLCGTFAVHAKDNRLSVTAEEYLLMGKYPEAIKLWEVLFKQLEKGNELNEQARLLQKIANAYQALGELTKAIDLLHAAVDYAHTSNDKVLQTYLVANLASVNMEQGNLTIAHKLFDKSIIQANTLGDEVLHAALLNDLAGVLIKKKLFSAAETQLHQSRDISIKFKLAEQEKRVLINLAITSILTHKNASAFAYIKIAKAAIGRTKFNFKNAKNVMRLGELLLYINETDIEIKKKQYKTSYDLLTQALNYFKDIDSKRELAMANGLLAELYFKTGNLTSVEDFYQRAIFFAQEINANEILYHWQWQYARYLVAIGNEVKSLKAYRQARFYYKNVDPLFVWTNISSNMSDDSPSVFHYELADLLLKQSSKESDKEKKFFILDEARDTIEGLKNAELQDYFKDSCVAQAKSKVSDIGLNIEDDTITVYPILFKDRLEILVSHKDTIERRTTIVSRKEVKNLIFDFRIKLEKRRTRDYLPLANQFYEWIIKPINELLVNNNIKTMVLIPDISMRSLPFAALHNGKNFLVEEFALAVSPGLQLTDRHNMDRGDISILMAGLSDSVNGLPALTHVRTEFKNIKKLYSSEILLNKKFNKFTLRTKLRNNQFNVAHIASHGNFSGNVSESYIVTHDGNITVNDLASSIGASQFRSQPIELLTLSACYTAAGDDKAALGLAGITIKAGARSSLATLWPINDVATAVMMREFYSQFKDNSLNKAEVLRNAQLYMLKDKRYRHPGYWSPFLLIGNWL